MGKVCFKTALEPSTISVFSTPADSITDCVLICKWNKDCKTMSFDKQSLVCKGFNVIAEDIVGNITDNKDLVYFTSAPEGRIKIVLFQYYIWLSNCQLMK